MMRAILILSLIISCSCVQVGTEEAFSLDNGKLPFILNDTLTDITELKRGDILVKPNHNWLPGTAWVKGGFHCGHAAVVLEGAIGNDPMEVLQKAVIFESHARKVPPQYELRKTKAYFSSTDIRYHNDSFSEYYKGYRYRLRPRLTEEQIESVIEFILTFEDGLSSWRALKKSKIHYSSDTLSHQTYWYCSHLIWQAYYTVLNIDLDPNGGLYVYPNDLISSPFFQNDHENQFSRIRF